jgi:antitoxin VapB
MMKAKVVDTDEGQIVVFPNEFRFQVDELIVLKHGGDIILRPKAENLSDAFELLAEMPNDFPDYREQD